MHYLKQTNTRFSTSDLNLTEAKNMQPLKYVELAELPSVVDIVTAARALGLSRTYAYQLARKGEFPCKVIRIGTCYRVPTAALLAVLGAE